MPTAGATPWPIWSRSSVRLRQLDQKVERCTHRAQPDSRAVALKDMLLDKGLDAGTGLPGAMFPRRADIDQPDRLGRRIAARARSEEHTSELQSLMRISYAVFCLKKKNNTTTEITSINISHIEHRVLRIQ